MKRVLLVLFTLPVCFFCSAQNPAAAPPQTLRILYMGAVAHLGNGEVIQNSVVGFEKGKIKLITDATIVRIDRTAYDTIINIQGKHIYPGLIALNTQIGLSEIEAVRATNDFVEVGQTNPSARSIIAYNTDSKVIPTLRSNGVLMSHIAPQGGLVSGQSSVVVLDAWNYEDASYKTDIGIHVNWPSMRIIKSRRSDAEEKQKERSDKSIAEIRKLFNDAKSYASEKDPQEKNLHLESMRGLFDGSKMVFVHCNYVKEIISSVAFFQSLNVKMVLVGGSDAWMVTDLLKAHNIGVIIVNTHNLPSREDEDIDLPYKLPSVLKQAGVNFAISVSGFWQIQNLAFQAGTSAAYGLSKEDALQSVTASAAKILGIESTVGTLEPGKDATFIIASGDLLDMKSSVVEEAFIQGRQINLDDTRKESYRKYKDKYGLK